MEQKIVNILKRPEIDIHDTAQLLLAAGQSLEKAAGAFRFVSVESKDYADQMLNDAKKIHAEFDALIADLARQSEAYDRAAETAYRQLTEAARKVRAARQDLAAELNCIPQVGDLERLLSLVERIQYLTPEARELFAATARVAVGGV